MGDGKYQEYYHDGTLRMEGRNINEESEGEWKYYYESGELRAIGNYINGLRNGEWRFYHTNGNVAAVGDYDKGSKVGIWKYYYENGAISSEGEHLKDRKDGRWSLYYPGGEIKGETIYENGKGESAEYYPSGKIKTRGQLKDGKREGKWIYYNELGLKEGEAVFDQDVGNYIGFYNDGTIKMEGKLKGEKRIGEWKLYNTDGDLVGTYKPIYEEEKPIFRFQEEDDGPRIPSEKPEYRYKKRTSRYFDERINEYRALILSSNPFWTALGEWPFSVEYYLQERLGYEFRFSIIRHRFFEGANNIAPEQVYTRGMGFTFRQKFYSYEGSYGMFYFGHQISYDIQNHFSNLEQSLSNGRQDRIGVEEALGSYGGLIGWRFMESAGESGFTMDAFFGVGIGFRNWHKDYPSPSSYDEIYHDWNQSDLYIPIIFGVNIGWASSNTSGPPPQKKN
jgi:antitoxin component YwqK of YwqJK toxin-antitoxin module